MRDGVIIPAVAFVAAKATVPNRFCFRQTHAVAELAIRKSAAPFNFDQQHFAGKMKPDSRFLSFIYHQQIVPGAVKITAAIRCRQIPDAGA